MLDLGTQSAGSIGEGKGGPCWQRVRLALKHHLDTMHVASCTGSMLLDHRHALVLIITESAVELSKSLNDGTLCVRTLKGAI